MEVTDLLQAIVPKLTASTALLIAVMVPLLAVLLRALTQVWHIPVPRISPIAVVLMAFLGALVLVLLVMLALQWQSTSPADRDAFLAVLSYGVFLFLMMVGGMFARYFWDLLQAGKGFQQAEVTRLLMPLLISLMIFYPLWTIASGSPRNFFSVVAAFQNGFFWQTIFAELRPIKPSTP